MEYWKQLAADIAIHKNNGHQRIAKSTNCVAVWYQHKNNKQSFWTCDIYPYSLQTMLSNCTTKLTTYQELNIVGYMSELLKRILRQGELFDKDFEDWRLIDRSGNMKDHLVVNRRRSILFTNSQFIARCWRSLTIKKRKPRAANKNFQRN